MGPFYDQVPLGGFQSCTHQVTYLQSGCNIMEGSLVADILHYSRFSGTDGCGDSVLHQYFSCTSLHVGFVHVTVYCCAPGCSGISHASDCMLALRISQFIAMHPFASVILMHQIACWLCAYRSLLTCTRLHRYFSCTRLHVGFAHIPVYCRAPVCIGISHAPDCMLAFRISQFIAVHPFASVFLMHQIACWLCAYPSLLPCTRLHRYFSCTRLHVGSAPVRRLYCARSKNKK